jgi:hypothetical protein
MEADGTVSCQPSEGAEWSWVPPPADDRLYSVAVSEAPNDYCVVHGGPGY